MVLAWDFTYLTSTVSQMVLNGQHGLVGSVWDPQDTASSFLSLEHEIDMKSITKAKTMLETIVWDPSLKKRHTLSVCSLPVQHNFQGQGAHNRGNFYILQCIGQIMEKSGGLVKALCFDSHGAHLFARKVLHGELSGLDAEDLSQVPFFGKLVYEQVDSGLPRFPIKIARYNKDIVWGMGGICILACGHPCIFGGIGAGVLSGENRGIHGCQKGHVSFL